MVRHVAYASGLAALLLMPAPGTLVISFYVLLPFFLVEWLRAPDARLGRMYRFAIFLGVAAWIPLSVSGWTLEPKRTLLSAVLFGASAVVAFLQSRGFTNKASNSLPGNS